MDLFKDSLSENAKVLSNNNDPLSLVPTVKSGSDIKISKSLRGRTADLYFTEICCEAINIKNTLKKIVSSKVDELNRQKKSGLKINPKKLSRVALNDLRVFKRNNPVIRASSSIHLLLDISRSMYNIQAESQKIVATLAKALSYYPKVNLGVSYYSSPECCVTIREILKHGERCNDNFISNFFIPPCGGTPTAEALMYAGGVLLNTSNEKKTIILVTDGLPDDIDAYEKMFVNLVNANINLVVILFEHEHSLLKDSRIRGHFNRFKRITLN